MPYKERITSITIPIPTKEMLIGYKELNNSNSWDAFFKDIMRFIDEHGETKE